MTLARWQALILLAIGTATLPACSKICCQLKRTHEIPAEVVTELPAPRIQTFPELAPGDRIPKIEVIAKSPPVAEGPHLGPMPPPEPVPAVPSPQSGNQDIQYGSLLDQKPRGPRHENPLSAAVRAHLDNQYALAVGHLSQFDRPNQELLLLLLPILDAAQTVDLTGRNPAGASQLTRQLETAAELTSKHLPLTITTAAFVYRVVQFGVYDPLPVGHRFLPGGIGMLYAEIDHVPVLPATQANGEQSYVTRLSGSIQMQDDKGRTVELYDAEKSKMVPELPFSRADFARSPVRDFFLKIEFPVPVKPGKYSLALEIRDPTNPALRPTRKVVDFLVGP